MGKKISELDELLKQDIDSEDLIPIVDKNLLITKKIKYSSIKGANENFVTNDQLTKLNSLSGTNTGDETVTTIRTKLGVASETTDGYLLHDDFMVFETKEPALGNPSSDGMLLSSDTDGARIWVSNTLDQLTDVIITTPSNDQVLSYDSDTSKWINKAVAEGGVTSVNGETGAVILDADDIDATADKNYVTSAEKTVLGNTSNTNTGDETESTIKTKLGVADTDSDGYLASTDWNVFNNKNSLHGVVSRPVGVTNPLPTYITSTTFTINCSTYPMQYYYTGLKVDVIADKSCTLSSGSGLYYIYFLSNTGNIEASKTFPGVSDTSNVLIATVVWNGSDYGIVNDERHGHTRNKPWHTWAHETIGVRYTYGITLTHNSGDGADATFATTVGEIDDEDIKFVVNAGTTGMIYYQTSATEVTFNKTPSTVPFNIGSNNRPQYVRSDTYALVEMNSAVNRYINIFVYATTDLNIPILLMTETVSATTAGANGYTSVANARAVGFPNLNAFNISREIKPIYRIVVRADGRVQALTPADDYRTVSSLPMAAGVASSIASNIYFEPAGNISSTDVQDAIEELDSEKQPNLPDQTGNTGKVLTTDGSAINWEAIPVTSVDGLTGDVISRSHFKGDISIDTDLTLLTTIQSGDIYSISGNAELTLFDGTLDVYIGDFIIFNKDVNPASGVVLADVEIIEGSAGNVRLTGAQTIYDVKSFDSFPNTPASLPSEDYQVANKKYVDGFTLGWGAITGSLTDQLDLNEALGDKADDNVVVKTSGNQSIEGIKTFTTAPVVPTPSNDNEAANKGFVMSAMTSSWWDDVTVATTANITIATALITGEEIDGYTLVSGDKVLVWKQTDKTENGIYVVDDTTPARASDADTAAEVNDRKCITINGDLYGKQLFFTTSTVTTLGSDNITFEQLAGAATLTAGTNISITSGAINVIDNPNFATQATSPLIGAGTVNPTVPLDVYTANVTSTLGSELITNGSFTGAATGWTLGASWTYATNAVSFANNGSTFNTLSQNITVTSGKSYFITLVASSVTTASCVKFEVSLGSVSSVKKSTVTLTAGTFSYTLIASATGAVAFTITPSANTDQAGSTITTGSFKIDDVSIKEITQVNAVAKISCGTEYVDIHTHGTGNFFMGRSSGLNISSGVGTTLALGYNALKSAYTCSSNIAIGAYAGENISGSGRNGNCFIGLEAGRYADQVQNSLYIGRSAGMYSNGSNLYIGYNSGKGSTLTTQQAYSNLGLGNYSLENITSGINNIAIGEYSGNSLQGGYYNTFIGGGSGQKTTTGIQNLYLGQGAGQNLITSSTNIAIGYYSMNGISGETDNVPVNNNIALGYLALRYPRNILRSMFLGESAGTLPVGAVADSMFLGTNCGIYAGTSTSSIYIGASAGEKNTSYFSTGIGSSSLATGDYQYVTGIGAGTLRYATAYQTIAIGDSALNCNTCGSSGMPFVTNSLAIGPSSMNAHESVTYTESITNTADRDFSSSTGNWSGTNWVIAGGVATYTKSASAYSYTLSGYTYTNASYYRVTIKGIVSTNSGRGMLTLSLGGGSPRKLGFRTTETREVILQAGATNVLTITPDLFFEGSIDDISIKKILCMDGGTFIGPSTGLGVTGTNGSGMTVIGSRAMQSTAGSTSTIAIGNFAAYSYAQGSASVFIGFSAASNGVSSNSIHQGSSLIAIGSSALYQSSGLSALAIGENAMYGASATSSFSNACIAIGGGALRNVGCTLDVDIITNAADTNFSSSTGNWSGTNWVIGSGVATYTKSATAYAFSLSGYTFTSGSYHQVIIKAASVGAGNGGTLTISLGGGAAKTINVNSTARSFYVYCYAGATNVLTITPDATFQGTIDDVYVKKVTAYGQYNSAIGINSLYSMTTGSYNLGIGGSNLFATTTGNRNVSIGYYSMYSNTTGSYNIGLGSNSIQNNQAGSYNIGVGANALYALNGGNQNISFGAESSRNLTTGYDNIIFGTNAFYTNTTGIGNVALGVKSLYLSTTGNYNLCLGFESGYSLTTGSGNILIGYQVGKTISGASSNQLYIDNSDTSTPLIQGDFSANTLMVNGQLSATTIKVPIGITGSRPTGVAGLHYFDTTINKPIWYNGTNWVDATGTTV